MDKLAQVRELDPTAEPKLLDQLGKTPPSTWPLVAEQYRASLALHQQLASKPVKAEVPNDPMAALHRSAMETPNRSRGSSDLSHINSLTETNRPSAAIGSLADPRTSRDIEAIVAQRDTNDTPNPIQLAAAPLSENTAPAEFAGNGPMYPIGGKVDVSTQPAAYEAPLSDERHVATRALGTDDSNEVPRRLPQPASAELRTTSKQRRAPAAGGGEDWQQLVDAAAEDLSRRVAASPTTTAEVHQHASLRLLQLLAGETEKALEPIPHIPPAEQDYWSRQIFAIATYLDHHSQPDDKRRAAASVGHLDEAVAHLRELGALSLRNLSFCKNVFGYGAYEPYENDTFSPGEQVSLYVEVENYHSSSSEKGYCTLLGATYELLDDKGKRVSGGDFPDVDDCCRSRRRDFHIQFGLSVPENLSPGRYRVELVVKDRQSDKLGHATVPFEIRSGGRKPPM